MILRGEGETEALGARLGRALRAGDVILLFGELGAGKTTLARGLARGCGYRGRVSSPTFALAHEYRGRRLTLHHLDLYRVRGGDLTELGLAEMLRAPGAALAVEWPDAAEWPKDHLEIRLAHANGARSVTLKGRGPRGRAIAGAAA